jgi:integrase
LTWQHVPPGFAKFTVASSKSGRARTLPTSPRAREVLTERWAGHVAKTRGADLVFADYSRGYVFACFRTAVKRAGVDWRTRVHDLRHHVGSALASANAPVDVIMSALGHAQISTVQRYLHHGADALDVAFRAVEAAKAGGAKAESKSA